MKSMKHWLSPAFGSANSQTSTRGGMQSMDSMKHWFRSAFGSAKQHWFVLAVGVFLLLPQVACAEYPGYHSAPATVYVSRLVPHPVVHHHPVHGGYADLNRDGWVSPREAKIVRREVRRERARRAHIERERAREAARAYEARGWHGHDHGWR